MADLALDASTYHRLVDDDEKPFVMEWLERVLGTRRATACDLECEGLMVFDVIVEDADGEPVIGGLGDDRHLVTERRGVTDQPPLALLRAIVEARRRG